MYVCMYLSTLFLSLLTFSFAAIRFHRVSLCSQTGNYRFYFCQRPKLSRTTSQLRKIKRSICSWWDSFFSCSENDTWNLSETTLEMKFTRLCGFVRVHKSVQLVFGILVHQETLAGNVARCWQLGASAHRAWRVMRALLLWFHVVFFSVC